MNRRTLSALSGALVVSTWLVLGQPLVAQSASGQASITAALPPSGAGRIPGNNNARDCTVCLLADPNGIEDRCFNASDWRGILSFYGDTWESPSRKGEGYNLILYRDFSDMAPSLDRASGHGYDLLVTAGFLWADAVADIAPRHPGQNYLLLDVDWVGGGNVMQITFAEHEGTYLVGVAAALKAKSRGLESPKFGFVGGVPGSLVTPFEMGYIQGIRSVYPEAEILEYYANDWARPELAKDVARRWYAKGVYAIFSAAGATAWTSRPRTPNSKRTSWPRSRRSRHASRAGRSASTTATPRRRPPDSRRLTSRLRTVKARNRGSAPEPRSPGFFGLRRQALDPILAP